MEKRSIFPYYELGSVFHRLLGASEDTPIHGDGYIISLIDDLLGYIQDFHLTVTTRLTWQLTAFQERLEGLPDGSELTWAQADELQQLVSNIQRTLEAELQGFETFIVTPKVIDVVKLLDDVAALFAPGVFNRLPDIARYDFQEAAKCIAFERPTAAAFHILRATEAVLRYFYISLIRHKRIKPPLMWGPIVKDLRARPKTSVHEILHNNLDYIRQAFRNPTQHPEKIYDIHEAQELWSLCVEATNRMIRTLASPSQL